MLRSVLLKLAGSERMRRMVSSRGFFRTVARRFVAGETATEALEAARVLYGSRMLSTISYLGEHAGDAQVVYEARGVYLELLARIKNEGLGTATNVSVKLSQLGLDLSENVAREDLESLVSYAETQGSFVRVDMEGSRYTD